jgi:hypothetical protein
MGGSRVGQPRTVRCPHCAVAFSASFATYEMGWDRNNELACQVERTNCPTCGRLLLWLVRRMRVDPMVAVAESFDRRQIFPSTPPRPCPAEVPKAIARDFLEASMVLPLSANASAT